MDTSRDVDLHRLKSMFNDHTKPSFIRQNAYKSFGNIRRQIKDRKLATLRLRLIRATRAEDAEAAPRLEQLIQDYSRKMGYVKPDHK